MASHNPNRHTQLPAYSLLSPDLPSHELPQYSTVVSRQSSSSAGVLPRYSTLEPSNSVARSLSKRAEHTFCSTFRNDSATLTVLSSAKSFQNTPRFSGGDNVAGTLSLSLENGESIHAVTISVRGRIITGATERGSYTFLDHCVSLWSKNMGTAPATIPNGQLLPGEYIWPFSFSFPSEPLILDGGNHSQTCVPQTFLERDIGVSVCYELVVHVMRGKTRSDHKIHTPIIYIPSIVPAPFSSLRLIAYLQRLPVPGPEADPEGWTTLSPGFVRGLILGKHDIFVQCKISLANPLSYVRGSIIPCHMTIEASDLDTFNLLALPDSIDVRLRRRLIYFNHAGGVYNKMRSPSLRKTEIRDVQTAVWWAVPEGSSSGLLKRSFQGEIHISKSLQPSCDFFPFTIQYSIVTLPLISEGFIPVDGDLTVSQTPVQIATTHAPGPIPRAYTPRQTNSRSRAHPPTMGPGSTALCYTSPQWAFS